MEEEVQQQPAELTQTTPIEMSNVEGLLMDQLQRFDTDRQRQRGDSILSLRSLNNQNNSAALLVRTQEIAHQKSLFNAGAAGSNNGPQQQHQQQESPALERRESIISGGIKLPSMIPPAVANNPSQDIGIDWFHFETRIRRVILEAVDPLTKKQYSCFDALEEVRNRLVTIQAKYEETLGKLDRLAKRNEALEYVERKLKDLENEVVMNRALERNDFVQLNERMETFNQRLRVAQSDVTGMKQYDDKLKRLQQQIVEVTDEYNVTVTQRLKEVSAGFIKQVQELDRRYRETQKDMQEVLVKIDSVHEFTQKNDSRFIQLHALLDELREAFEDSHLELTAPAKELGDSSGADTTRVHPQTRLRQKIQSLEKQVEEFRVAQADQDMAIRNGLHAVTNNRIEQMIFQNIAEMFHRVFSVKSNQQLGGGGALRKLTSISGYSSQKTYKNKGGSSVNEYLLQLMQNFREWRQAQLEKGRYDVTDLYTVDEDIPGSLHNDGERKLSSGGGGYYNKISASLEKGNDSVKQTISNEEQELLRKQQELLQGGGNKEELDEATKERLQVLQLTDQEAMLKISLTSALATAAGGDQRQLPDQEQFLTLPEKPTREVGRSFKKPRKKRPSNSSIAKTMHRPSILSTGSPQQMLKQALEGTIDPSDSLQEESDVEEGDSDEESEDQDNYARRKRARLNSFLESFSQERLKELLNQELLPLKDQISEALEGLALVKHDIKEQLPKLSHEPLLQMIGRNRGLIENLKEELTKLKESTGGATLQHQIQKVEVQLSMMKNDLQQQLYKGKEFDEQMYMKQIEISEKLDYELIKVKKNEQSLAAQVDKNYKAIKEMQADKQEKEELIQNMAESIIMLLELEHITSALEQQDEIDRRAALALQDSQIDREDSNDQRYKGSSMVQIAGKEFPRQNLIFCRRVFLETLLNSAVINKKPFSQLIQKYQSIQHPQNPHKHDNIAVKPFYSNHELYWMSMQTRLHKISSDFQSKLDAIAEEMQRQNYLANRGVPKEIQRIKEQHRIRNADTPDNTQQQTFKRNVFKEQQQHPSLIENVATQGGLVRETNKVIYQVNSNNNLKPQQQRKRLNQSMLENHTQLPSLVDTQMNRSSDTRITRQPQFVKPVSNIGNVEYLPIQKQPIKGPMMLLHQQKSRNSFGSYNTQQQQQSNNIPLKQQPNPSDISHITGGKNNNAEFGALEVKDMQMANKNNDSTINQPQSSSGPHVVVPSVGIMQHQRSFGSNDLLQMAESNAQLLQVTGKSPKNNNH